MSRFHQYYFDHLVAIHNALRNELKSCTRTLPTVTQPASIKTSLQKVLQFCRHLQGHHDLEEAVVFPAFAAVTDISHWSNSHEVLENTLDRIRKLAQQGIDQDGKGFESEKEKLVEELQSLSDIVLPHLSDEEYLSNPAETIKMWPTEKDMRRAFPWMG
ncbi:hypothetical protein BGZ80_009755 [Entomortierella chlamydospora]|uniref:Hemerythrin-like domain-containing protein n=1 Tax=Entomortierella chlamydospora TaxID=101097 RepID=A0A9P6MWV7_9FUNG|nr:hypothetical protein BGX20_011182 [Mortierella sp. AD010]KAG0005357.1 hypothetical protein BGZ79_005335 [Entomortierella chlamydospora]KAG0015612.1 hypothetical protein BGZ80_009755 [Entomortierella chlamydospora]